MAAIGGHLTLLQYARKRLFLERVHLQGHGFRRALTSAAVGAGERLSLERRNM
jgi:hypothetical protein